MGLPFKEDNAEGYDKARLSIRANDFRNKTYLLVHGSLDDNVHYQQSMALARSLELHDVSFEQIVRINTMNMMLLISFYYHCAFNNLI